MARIDRQRKRRKARENQTDEVSREEFDALMQYVYALDARALFGRTIEPVTAGGAAGDDGYRIRYPGVITDSDTVGGYPPEDIPYITDGAAPASSPTPEVQPGVGYFAVKWDPVANADPITYEVHVSATTGFTPDASTKAGEAAGTLAFVRKLPAGTDFVLGTTYYFKIVAKDGDGSAAASAQDSDVLAKLGTDHLKSDNGTPVWSLAPTIRTGPGWLKARWLLPSGTEDPLFYHVFIDTSSGFTPNFGTNYVGTTFALESVIARDGANAPLSTATTYYVKVQAVSDLSGLSANSSASTGTSPGVIDGSVTTIQNLDAGNISTGSLSAARIATGSLDASKITSNTITANEIAADAITTSELAADSVTTSELAANAVIAENILAGEITAEKLETIMLLASSLIAGDSAGSRAEVGFGQTDGMLDGFVGVRCFLTDGTTQSFYIDATTGNAYLKGRLDFGDGSRLDDDMLDMYEQEASGYQEGRVVQVASNSGGSGGNTLPMTFGAPTTPGNALVAAVCMIDKDGAAPTPSAPAGWTFQTSVRGNSSYDAGGANESFYLYVFTKDSVTTATSGVTFSLGDTGYSAGVVVELGGCVPGTAGVDKVATADRTDASAQTSGSTGTTATLSQAEEFAVGFIATEFDRIDVGSETNGFAAVAAPWVNDAGTRALTLNCAAKEVSATTALETSGTYNSAGGPFLRNSLGAIITIKRAPSTSDPASPIANVARFYAKDTDGETRLFFKNSHGIVNPVGTPPGVLSPFAGSTAPDGWLLCYGQSVLRDDYPALFAVIGTTYGSVDGTHFTLPDMRGRTPLTLDNMGGSDAGRLTMANTLGGTGGEEKHLLTAGESGLPGHTHTLDTSQTSASGGSSIRVTSGGGAGVTGGLSAGAEPAANSHNNLQPYILLNYLIKY